MKKTFLFLLCVLPLPAQELPPLELGGIREEHAFIPMRDGTRLSAYLYFPKGDGPWPVVFEQRYASLTGAGTRKTSAELASHGFVVAMVNFRGSQKSEGRYVGYRALAWGEQKDGYDTCEWLGTRPWSTGKVGSFGSSQGGFAQNFLAVTQPPHLTCQYMVDTGLSLFHEGYRIGGVTRPTRFADFGSNCRNPEDNNMLLREWDAHPDYDEYWQAEDCSRHFSAMNVPCFTIGSWYDFMIQGSVLSFQGRQHQGGPNSRGHQQLVLGPWLHGRLNKGFKVGDLIYPENATWPEVSHMVRWFVHWLKGVNNGVEKEPAVRYYVMGAVGEPSPGNLWKQTAHWPPISQEKSLFLSENGQLSNESPTRSEAHTILPCDPAKPMSIPGRGFPGAKDARSLEEQSDVRVWTTSPMPEPVEITGDIQIELWVRSTVPDTDFIARISDVYPDGRSILLMDYPLRARYREGFDHQKLLQSGEATRLKWRIGTTSLVLNKGHRLRLTLTNTGAPLYEPNNQTGGPQMLDWLKSSQPGSHAILHEKEHASRILLPIIP